MADHEFYFEVTVLKFIFESTTQYSVSMITLDLTSKIQSIIVNYQTDDPVRDKAQFNFAVTTYRRVFDYKDLDVLLYPAGKTIQKVKEDYDCDTIWKEFNRGQQYL